MKIMTLAIFLLCGLSSAREDVKLLKLATTAEIERADLYVWKPERNIAAIMVFCPGHNGSGEAFVNDPEWRNFAVANHLALCGLSFASPMALTQQGKGYSHVARESGKILLDALDNEFSNKRLPMLFYGYSAGARFSTSFLAWKPDRVRAWCASGVGTWPSLPTVPQIAPGIVACGEFDAACYWNSLIYFQSGRKKDYPWTWISLKNLEHEHSGKLDQFVKEYFTVILNKAAKPYDFKYFDISTCRQLQRQKLQELKMFSVSLPGNQQLIENWRVIHYP